MSQRNRDVRVRTRPGSFAPVTASGICLRSKHRDGRRTSGPRRRVLRAGRIGEARRRRALYESLFALHPAAGIRRRACRHHAANAASVALHRGPRVSPESRPNPAVGSSLAPGTTCWWHAGCKSAQESTAAHSRRGGATAPEWETAPRRTGLSSLSRDPLSADALGSTDCERWLLRALGPSCTSYSPSGPRPGCETPRTGWRYGGRTRPCRRVRRDEPKALGIVEPLHRAARHLALPAKMAR